MKKLLALLLTLLLLAGLTACTFVLPMLPGTAVPKASDTIETQNNNPFETAAPVPQTDAPETKPVQNTEPAGNTEPSSDDSAFREQTLVDTDLCSMKIVGFAEDSFWGFTLQAELKNKTEDKNLRFYVDSGSVNGVCYDPYLYTDVAAGETATADISFYNDDLNDLLGRFTDVELLINIYDADNWAAGNLVEDSFHIYPYGKAEATTYVREAQPTDTVLVDNNEFSFIMTDCDPEGFWGYTVNFYLVNKTKVPLYFYVTDDVTVNGHACDTLFGERVAPGKVAFSYMYWSDATLEDLGVTNVENIEFNLCVRNSDDFMADNIFDDVVTLTP